ncbi:MAG: hypothetical protein PHI96_01300 [Desulfovibrio sp.]|nr:hypothetical protein [Desulfovibrio sp.]
MKQLLLALALLALCSTTDAMADSSIKNQTKEHQFFEVKCPNTQYEMQVDPGRRVVVPSQHFSGGNCSVKVEGHEKRYRINDHNHYQIQPNGTVTKTAG